MTPFERVAIIGVGLLGGSLALACKSQGLARKVVGFGRRRDNLEKARQLGVIDAYAEDLNEAVKDADLIVLCSPVGSFKSLTEKMLSSVKPGAIVTDVGSVKAPVTRDMEKLVAGSARFVGGHPIAGGEKSGVEFAEKDLFVGAKCVLTPTPNTDPAALRRIVVLWERMGATVILMDADEHDYIFGAVSHLPHVVAYALVNAVAGLRSKNHDRIAAFCGSGFKDITRIASSEPAMWRDICLANKGPVLGFIDRFQETLGKIRADIENGEGESLERAFSEANRLRSSVCEKMNDYRD